ncbi:hypothetical protein BC829DRAFT_388283 [Chytridium lagenaria]|nr:hypothetical protein BC829DRAFT_388283 [Chytridium lagenaria]
MFEQKPLAIARAHFALKEVPESDFGIGIEGGIQKVGEKWFESGWVVVVDRNGKMGMGTSARYEISGKIMNRIFAGQELADIMDDMTGTRDVRHNSGAMGAFTFFSEFRIFAYTYKLWLTNFGSLQAYLQKEFSTVIFAILTASSFAFAPWLSDEMFWK